jgi:dihydrofolate synthase / folylpolyglutamate synthase
MNIKLFQKFQAAENYLESLSNLTDVNFFAGTSDPKFHFARAKYLLKLAGNPDKKLKIIHIAGTSGKGSVVNHIYNILQTAGHKVGAHFSPFVSVPTEKIQINNKHISVKDFIDLVEQIKPIIQKCHETYGPPSYFECWIVMALLYFKQHKCNYVVLETGCGGRYDATNAVEKTLLSIITNIGLDHTHILGKTYEKIAFEKAGIIRPKGKVFTNTERPQALKIIEKIAHQKKADLTILQKQEHPNQALAIEACQFLKIKPEHIKKGLIKKSLPARFETVQKTPHIIMDGAHNPDKLDYLTNRLTKIKKTNQKIHLVCGLTQNKNIKDCYKKLISTVDSIQCTRPLLSFRKFTDPVILAKELKKLSKLNTKPFIDPNQALLAAQKLAKTGDIILITGSFFLCSDLRKHWYSIEKQLDQKTNFPR